MEDVKKEVILKYKIDENTVSIQNEELSDFYFKKVFNILQSYSKYLEKNQDLTENRMLLKWLKRLENTFELLKLKYFVNNNKLEYFQDFLKIDPTSSGFPHFKEIMTLKSDITEAISKFEELPDFEKIQDQMIQDILKYEEKPVYQQYLFTQKRYYEKLIDNNELFLNVNIDLDNFIEETENGFVISWSNYDSSVNLPVVYFAEIEVSGKYSKEALVKELAYLSNANLKLVTIASKIDEKFDFLHPKQVKRVYIGPLYSNEFTEHNDLLQKIIEEAEGDRRFIFCFSEESVVSYKTTEVTQGIFSSSKKQELYYIDKFNLEANEAGVSNIHRKMITPYEVYQRLVEEEHTNDLIKKSDKFIYSIDKEIIGN